MTGTSYAAVNATRRSLILAGAVLLIALVGAPEARAGGLGCEGQVLERPFAPWLDPAQYVLAPDGDLSAGAAGWQLSGAQVVDDNEPWNVHGSEQAAALRLGAGDSATTPPMCVSLLHPTMRFFARSTGGALGALAVEVVLEDGVALPIGVVPGLLHGGWAPSLVLPVVANVVDDEVAFRFTVLGADSAWVVDDVYVDPYGKG